MVDDGSARPIFVSEYVCGGAWPESRIDGSLAREGRAMLLALVDDLLRVPDRDVVTTWDARLGRFPRPPHRRLHVIEIETREQDATVFEACCRDADFVFVIAPEFHNILSSRNSIAEAHSTLIGCSRAATELCSDKQSLADSATAHRIATINTATFNPSVPVSEFPFPIVVKPRDGAGSTDIFRVDDTQQLTVVAEQLLRSSMGCEMIQQPFVDGLACSTAALIAARSGRIDVLPSGEQLLSNDGRFRYLGANLPGRVTASQRDTVEDFVRRCCTVWPGLSGYVGFDLLLPFDKPDEVVLVEINPRLTTTYLAWRQLTEDNLLARLLPQSRPTEGIQWSREEMRWRSE